MTFNGINSINSVYNKNVYWNSSAKNSPVFCGDKEDSKRISELQNAVNTTNVKVPLTYSKLDEKDLPYGLKAHFYKLSNGQKVVILPKEGETVIRSYVNTGSLNEPDNLRGISHYIEHNLFNGSEGLEAGEFFKTTDKIGAETNASTGLAETNYFISSHLLNSNDLENEIKIHASMLETPKFSLDMLEKEKGIVNSEINMITSNPENIAYNNTLKNLFNIKTSSNDVIAGTTDNINNLTREAVVNYFNDNYYPANIVTVVSGEIEPENTMKLLSKYFSSNKKQPPVRHFENIKPIEQTVRQDIISDKTKSPLLVMGFRGPENNNAKDLIYTEALTRLMFQSSGAEKTFRNINATVGAMQEKILSKPDAPKAIMIVGEASEDNSEAMLKKIYGQILKQQNNFVSQEDLNILKRDMKKSFTKMFESSFAINDYIGVSLLENRVNSINEFEKIVDEMTPQDLQAAAKKYFDLNKTAITMLHPIETDKNTLTKNYNASQNISFTGAVKKQAYNIDKVKQYKLPNNYNVVTYDSNLPDVYCNLAIKTEEPVDPKNPATFAVLNEILDNGTAKNSQEEFSKQKEKYGVDVFAEANRYGIICGYDCDIKDFNDANNLFKELLESPRFTKETFDKAVSDISDRLKRQEKSPSDKLNPELMNYSHSKDEILEGLKTLTLDDVKHTYEALNKNAKGLASIAAPYSSNPDFKNKIFTEINELKPVNPYVPKIFGEYSSVDKTKVMTEPDNKNQAKIVMAYKFRVNGNRKDDVTLKLLNIILGGGPTSRLFDDLREKQKLAYAVKSVIDTEHSTGLIKLSIKTTTDNKLTGEKSFDNLQKSINGFKANIDKITKEKVSEEELEKAKLIMKNNILSVNEKTCFKNTCIMGDAIGMYGIDNANKFLEIIDTITTDDIYNAANYVFSGKPLYSIVATQDTLDYNKEYLAGLER